MADALKIAAEKMGDVMKSLDEAFYAATDDTERWAIHKQHEAARTQLLDLLGLYREATWKQIKS